ncbi:TonB-dependent receptor [Novosphingobium flavum]|uniref:TonB-dependent receptor n=1 Tax=Novosphingobium flavum TaxID=1778672 RepID=A0A7X1FT43_9SPHN|nr:TonB-dependent receptor [Novosphingobium flavum]MBC2666483.1 TonB-dependent receptor [Novosphingobium flavum]
MKNVQPGVLRPVSLRQRAAAAAMGIAAIGAAAPALAQQAQPAEDGEVQLETLKIEDKAADVNPYTQKGAPYKARVSGDDRRVKPLAETPATITVLTQTQLQESGRSDLRTVLASQPGITLGTGENGNAFGDRYIIRGQEMKSDVFVDGLRDPGLQSRETFAIEQLEITKGPSATFAGRGASGGSVNAITKQASTDYSFNAVDLTVGNADAVRATVDSNLALSDKLAVRANLLFNSEYLPERGEARRRRFGAALALKGQISDSVTASLDYYHLTVRDRQDLGQAIANVTAGGQPYYDIPAYTQKADFQNASVNVVTGKLRIEPFDGFVIENAARYGRIDNGYLNTAITRFTRGASDPVAPGAVDYRISASRAGWQKIEFFADRLNILGEFETGGLKHDLVAGVEFTTYNVQNRFGQLTTTQGAAATTAVASGYSYAITGAYNCINGTGTALNAYCVTDGKGNLLANSASLLGRTSLVRNTDPATIWQVQTLGGYVMDSIDVADWLNVSGGARFDAFDYRLLTNTFSVNGTAAGPRYDYNDVLWGFNAGVTLKPRSNGTVYFAWSTAADINGGESDIGTNCGYGGLCSVVDPVTGQVVYSAKPERSNNFELGTKWELFDSRLLLTAALFQTVKRDVMEGLSADSYSINGGLNSGKFRVRGVELGLAGNLTERLSGQISASFATSRVLESLNPGLLAPQLAAGATNVGKRLANFANNGVDAQLRYQLTDRLAIGGNVTWKSEMYGGQPDTAAAYVTTVGSAYFGQYSIRIPAYATFGGFISYKVNNHLTVRVNGLNLGDKLYYTAAYRSGGFAYLGDRRSVKVTLSGKF